MIWRKHLGDKKILFVNDRHEEEDTDKEDRRKLYDKRILSLLNAGDTAVFGGPIDLVLWQYYNNLGLAKILPENIFYVEDYLNYPSLTKAVLANKNLIKELKKRKFDYLVPYIESLDTEVLAEKIGTKLLRSAELTDKLNNKSYYREVLVELGLPVIPGYTVGDFGEAGKYFRKLRSDGFGNVVLKKERSVSGFGVFVVDSIEKLQKLLTEKFSRERNFLLEGFIEDIDFSPNVQYWIGPDKVDFLVISDQLFEKDRVSYAGNHFPSGAQLKSGILSKINDFSLKFCRYLQQKRCYGIVGIDFLVTGDGRIYSCEANVRFNGSTFPALVAKYFFKDGDGFSWRSFSEVGGLITIKNFLSRHSSQLINKNEKIGLFPISVDLLPIFGEGQFVKIF